MHSELEIVEAWMGSMDETTYQLHRALAAWIQTSGVFVAVFLFSIVRSRLESRLRVYEAGHEGWMQFLQIAAQHLDLGLLSPDDTRSQERPRKDREVERAAYLMLLAVLQREYFLLKNPDNVASLPPCCFSSPRRMFRIQSLSPRSPSANSCIDKILFNGWRVWLTVRPALPGLHDNV